MGYSHYLWRPLELEPEKFRLVVADFQKVVSAAAQDGILIAGWHGEDEPEINDSYISFNGQAYLQEACETMRVDQLRRKQDWETAEQDLWLDCCKTKMLPYDILVVALLFIFKYHYGDEVQIRSDGQVDTGELLPGWKLCQRILGYAKRPVVG